MLGGAECNLLADSCHRRRWHRWRGGVRGPSFLDRVSGNGNSRPYSQHWNCVGRFAGARRNGHTGRRNGDNRSELY